jgi:glycosyltransferase involved in cell wall biosynthesis
MSLTSGGVRTKGSLRVLMLVPYPNIQGPLPKHVPLLVASLRTLGCDIETENWSRHSDHESYLAKVVGRAADLWRIYARLRRGRFDVMYITTAHTWAGLMRDIPLVLLSKGVCPHRVIKFHGSFSGELRAPGHTLLKLASRVLVGACDASLVLSQEERVEWSAFYPAGRFEVVANAFTPELLGAAPAAAGGDRGEAASARAGYRSGVPTLLFVGRLMPEKGVFDLVRAMARVTATVPCRLLVAGDGASSQAMFRMAEELGTGDSMQMLGHVSGPDLARCYEEADALVLPSYREGFPTVLLEAMSAGLPIVTTALRGAVDRLEEGVNALFVPPRRPDLLAQALARILSDSHLRALMAANNLAKIKEFAPDVVAPQYLAILESVVDEPTAATRAVAEAAP